MQTTRPLDGRPGLGLLAQHVVCAGNAMQNICLERRKIHQKIAGARTGFLRSRRRHLDAGALQINAAAEQSEREYLFRLAEAVRDGDVL